MIDRRLQILRLVRQHGTVTAAAAAAHLTPSAVSQQLRTLARDLDVDLLERHGRGVRLTDAAELLVGHADALLARWEEAEADLDALRRGERGRIRVCGFPSAIAALLAPMAQRLRRDEPGLEVRVVQAEPAASLDLLLSGEVDLAVLEVSPETPPTTDPRFDQQPLLDDLQQLIVPADHPLATADRVSLARAADEDWVGGPDAYDRIVVDLCNRAGFTPRIVHRAQDWSAYTALVAAGLGVALIPHLAVIPSEAVRRLELSDRPAPSRRILTCVRSGSQERPAIRRVRQGLADVARPHRTGA